MQRLPDLFAGKVHAVLCRKWKSRMKGRDWYDLVLYAARHPQVNLGHLETRMRQSGDYGDDAPLTRSRLLDLLRQRLQQVDIARLLEAEGRPTSTNANSSEIVLVFELLTPCGMSESSYHTSHTDHPFKV